MTYPQRLSVTVLLDGIDVTNYVDPKQTIVVKNILTRQMDTCSLTFERSGAIRPVSWQELVILDGAIRLFGGYVLGANDENGADLDVDIDVSATDYSIRLEKVNVKKEYTNMTDAAIIADLFASYIPTEGYDVSAHVFEVKLHTQMRFNRMSLLDCITYLAKLAGADFYVDPDKKLHYFKSDTETETAPFALSDNPNLSTSFPYHDFTVNRDGADIVNRVEVVGGNYRSEDTEFFLPGTGQANRISLPFKLHAPDGETSILVYRNDGTLGTPVWTQLEVRTGYIDQLDNTSQCLFYYQEKVIEQLDNFPNLANAIKIIAKYEVPLRTRVVDKVSIDFYGMIFDGVIVDSAITDKATARLAALTMLKENANEKTAIKLKTMQPGLRSGQIVSVTNTTHGVSGSYLIQSVESRVGIAGAVVHHVALGVYNHDLIDLMLALSKSSKPKVEWRTDEVLDELLQTAEELFPSESIDLTTSTGPYYFSNDPLLAFIWGFGSLQN